MHDIHGEPQTVTVQAFMKVIVDIISAEDIVFTCLFTQLSLRCKPRKTEATLLTALLPTGLLRPKTMCMIYIMDPNSDNLKLLGKFYQKQVIQKAVYFHHQTGPTSFYFSIPIE